MRHLLSIIFVVLAATQISNAQCRSSRTVFSIGVQGNQTFSADNTQGLVGVQGISLQVQKQRYDGFSYGAIFGSRRMSFPTESYAVWRSAQHIGLTMKQTMVRVGNFSIGPFSNVYVGRSRNQSMSTIDSDADVMLNTRTLVGAEVGVEFDYSIGCQFGLYGRSSVAFEELLSSQSLSPSVGSVSARPLAEIGLRIGV